jgi:hypothetical protein
METLDALAMALGLATLAGINLYLTVFVTGLAVQLGWVVLPAGHEGLAVLADPWIIGVAGVLYVLEFFADKVPWVDSLNDSVHTAIRPVGGALLAVLALGEANPVVAVVAALIGGGASLTAHAVKATTRLATNASPEPVSNIGLSLGEDVVVLGGLTVLVLQPLLAAGIALLLLVLAWVFLPRLLRSTRATAWLAWRKLNAPPDEGNPEAAPNLPAACEIALRRAQATSAAVAGALRCVSGGGPRLPKNHPGWIVRFEGEPASVFFVAPKLHGTIVVDIPVASATWELKTKFHCEALAIRNPDGETHRFLFQRGRGKHVSSFAEKAIPDSHPPTRDCLPATNP